MTEEQQARELVTILIKYPDDDIKWYAKYDGTIIFEDLFSDNKHELSPLKDLDIICQVEKTLSELEQQEYCKLLIGVVNKDMSTGFGPDGEIEGNPFAVFTATAAERAEAILRTKNLWKD